MTKVVLKLKVKSDVVIKSDVTNSHKNYKAGDEVEVYSDDNGKVPSWIKDIVLDPSSQKESSDQSKSTSSSQPATDKKPDEAKPATPDSSATIKK